MGTVRKTCKGTGVYRLKKGGLAGMCCGWSYSTQGLLGRISGEPNAIQLNG